MTSGEGAVLLSLRLGGSSAGYSGGRSPRTMTAGCEPHAGLRTLTAALVRSWGQVGRET